MAEIFISYAREDKSWVSKLVQAVESYGWSIWWDPNIPSGKEYDEIIEKELSSARCIIVVWSRQSIVSSWVKEEAQEAFDQDKIIPISIEGVKPPLGFRRLQIIDFTQWDGTVNSHKIRELVEQLEKKLDSAPDPHLPKKEYQQTEDFFTRRLDYDTGQVTVIFRIIRRENEILSIKLIRISAFACNLFLIPPDTDVSNTTLKMLYDNISEFVDANNMEAFLNDQDRLINQFILGREMSLARVPLRLNLDHPFYHGRILMPIIIGTSETFPFDGNEESVMAISFIAISQLCNNLMHYENEDE